MKVTYIGHSGFLVETEIANLLFDYSEGILPETDTELPLLVFVSHAHPDHYNPEIFRLAKTHKNIQYFLSRDIHISDAVMKEYKLTKPFINKKVMTISAGLRRVIPLKAVDGESHYIIMDTIRSTDQGVAFLLDVFGRNIYHAGDLNWWAMEGDTKQQLNNMGALFKTYMENLTDKNIFLAFAPLDPRQGKYYKLGIEYLLNAAHVAYVMPMHFWNQPEIMDQYEAERKTKALPTVVVKMKRSGESVCLE